MEFQINEEADKGEKKKAISVVLMVVLIKTNYRQFKLI